MSGVNEIELKIIDWLKSERERGSKVWPFLREVAEGEVTPPDGEIYEYGDAELGSWLADLLDNSHTQHADTILTDKGADLRAVRELRRTLAASQGDPAGWLNELDPMVIRVFLMQVNGNDDLYVHSLIKGYHPNNRYRVDGEDFVYEPGWTAASGRWSLPAKNRQICDEPIGERCSCRIEQRERGGK